MKLHSTTTTQLINGLKLFNNPTIPLADPARIITLIPPQNHVLLYPWNQINKLPNCDALPGFPNPQAAVSNLENTKNGKEPRRRLDHQPKSPQSIVDHQSIVHQLRRLCCLPHGNEGLPQHTAILLACCDYRPRLLDGHNASRNGYVNG